MKHDLKKVLGISFGIAVVIGGTIGVGILRTPGNIAALIPNAWLILTCWLVGGLYILLAASSYAELTTMLPKAGGAYNYIKRAFGEYAGFVSGWFDYIINTIAPAYFCIVLSEYVFLIFPQLNLPPTLVAVLFLITFTAIHISGVKSGSVLQQLTSTIKVILFLVLTGVCFLRGGEAHLVASTNITAIHAFSGGLMLAILKAFQMIIGTYDGWMSVSFFAEENADPAKVVPRSYFMGAIAVLILYLLINAAVLYVLPINDIGKSHLAVADAAGAVLGNGSALFIKIFAVFSLISILNAYMMIPARILFGLSRDGFFIQKATIINKGGTPVVALLCSFVISFFLIIFSSFEQLFSLGAFMTVGVTGLAYASVIKLRKAEPALPRPYLAWGYPYSTYITLLVTLALFTGFALSDVKSLLIILIITLVSYVVYALLIKKRITEN